jgi:hypothetical protein
MQIFEHAYSDFEYIIANSIIHYTFFFIISIMIIYFFLKNTSLDTLLTVLLHNIKNKKKKEENLISELNIENLKVNEADELIDFLDKIIKTKFNFYFINEILPYYQAGEKIDKPTLKEIQERFYIDVSALLNKNFKKLYKKYFTTQGIEIYINEKFIYFLNKFDSLNTEEKITDTTIHKLLK